MMEANDEPLAPRALASDSAPAVAPRTEERQEQETIGQRPNSVMDANTTAAAIADGQVGIDADAGAAGRDNSCPMRDVASSLSGYASAAGSADLDERDARSTDDALLDQQVSSKVRRFCSDAQQPHASIPPSRDLEEGYGSHSFDTHLMDGHPLAAPPGAYRVVPGGPPRRTSVEELHEEDPDTPTSVDYSPNTGTAIRAVSASAASAIPPAPFVPQPGSDVNTSGAAPRPEQGEADANGGDTPFFRQASLDASVLDSMVILAEANLVVEDDDEDESRSHIDATIVFQADPIPMQDGMHANGVESQKRRGLLFWVGMVAIGLVTIAVVVGVSIVAVERKSQGSTSASQPGTNGTNSTTLEALIPLFQASLPNYTTSQLQDATSPQALAFRWVTSPANFVHLVGGQNSSTNELASRLVGRMNQQYALATLFYASSGDVWWVNNSGWLQGGAHECEWFGCGCHGANEGMDELDARLRSLNLTHNGLARTPVPRELGLLTDLQSLDLSLNRLTGPLPTELGQLRRLSNLNMHSSKLTGAIPSEIGYLSVLEHFSLSDNQMTSTIPTEIGRLSLLRFLDFGLIHGDSSTRGKGLVGSLPNELFGLTQLEDFNVITSSLTGTLPSAIGRLGRLTSLWLSNNFMSGTVPTQLGVLTNLIDLLLVNNHTGTIPTEIGRLTKLDQLMISGDTLNGTIPTEFGRLSGMVVLYLDSTSLSGTIPTQLGSMSALEILSLSNTNLTGSMPSGLCQVVTGGNLIVGIDCGEVACDCGCKCGQLF